MLCFVPSDPEEVRQAEEAVMRSMANVGDLEFESVAC